jgi:hypothetical protein
MGSVVICRVGSDALLTGCRPPFVLPVLDFLDRSGRDCFVACTSGAACCCGIAACRPALSHPENKVYAATVTDISNDGRWRITDTPRQLQATYPRNSLNRYPQSADVWKREHDFLLLTRLFPKSSRQMMGA